MYKFKLKLECQCEYKGYKLAASRRYFFCQHLSREKLPPGHENPAMGFFWGVDQD